MFKLQLKNLFLASVLTTVIGVEAFAQSNENRLTEACENNTLKQQVMSDREQLARAEQRSDTLWAKLFEIQLQEIDLQTRLDDLDYRLTPDGIRQALAFVGSVRPMDELRESLRMRLEAERSRMTALVEHLALARQRVEESIRQTDSEIERLRNQLGAAAGSEYGR
jgi:predicted  nucleic acid-binding Zn-ribbon protein